jgi:hypothetical protein
MSMPVNRKDFLRLKGELHHFDKQADSGRIVRMIGCPECDNNIWNEPLSFPDLIVIKPGTLDDMSWAAPVGNIWTAKRAPWIPINGDLVNFEHQPVSRDPLYAAWTRATRT